MNHTPVLLHEVTELLKLEPGAFVIDGTVDGGGHAEKILEAVGPKGKLLGIDRDPEMLEEARKHLKKFPNFLPIAGDYADLPEILKKKKLGRADALILDLGFSSYQLERSGRGFSFRQNELLIMTYSREDKPAWQTLRELKEYDLAHIIRTFGEERYANRIARAIKLQGKEHRITTTFELRDAILQGVPKNYERGRIDPATRTFQALRIYVNDELGSLERLLQSVRDVLAPGSRLVIISFHSLEDRIVKNYFRTMASKGELQILTKKPITPQANEIKNNPRSRSAKLRVAEIQ